MPDIPWSMKPHEVIEAAKVVAKASKDGKNLTALQRAFWEVQHGITRKDHRPFEFTTD